MSNIDILRSVDDLLSFRTQDLLLLANSLGVSTNDDILIVAEKIAKKLLKKASMPSLSFELFQEIEKFMNVRIRMCAIIGGLTNSEIDALINAVSGTNIPQVSKLFNLQRNNNYSELRKELCDVFEKNISNKNVYNKFIEQIGEKFIKSLNHNDKQLVKSIALPDILEKRENVASALDELPEAQKNPYSRLNLGGYDIPMGKPVEKNLRGLNIPMGEPHTTEEMERPRALGDEPGQIKFIGDYDIPFPRREPGSEPTEIKPIVTPPKRKKRFGLF